jgi:hypothetical protein
VAVLLAGGPAWGQLSTITAASLLPDQQTLDFNAMTPGTVSGTDPAFVAFGLSMVSLVGTHTASGDTLSSGASGNALCSVSNTLTIVAPGGAIDNQGTGAGWGFELDGQRATQCGLLVVDQTNHQMAVEVYDQGILLDTLSLTVTGGFPNPPLYFESAVPFDEFRFVSPTGAAGWGVDDLVIAGLNPIGPSCTLNAPVGGATVGGTVLLDYDVDHVTPGTPVDATFGFSTDAGATWTLCAAGGLSVNPAVGLTTPMTGLTFEWDSVTDAVGLITPETVDLRVGADDGAGVSYCSVSGVDVDNVIPPPSCTLALTSATPVRTLAEVDLVPDSPSTGTVDATFEWSTDSGTSWNLATPGPAHANPMVAVPITVTAAFAWDSRADGVALAALVPGVLLRATVDDGVAPLTGECQAVPFDVDNTSLCPGTCGDCDENLTATTILDALVAAQIAAGLVTPTAWQTGCCDVNSSMSIEVIDALLMAQDSAGLTVTLTCP